MPQTTLDKEVVKNAVLLACRAPSIHNSQPWHWVADDAGLGLFVDRRRWMHSADSSGREAIISCGAVLDHLRIAMMAAGLAACGVGVEEEPEGLIVAGTARANHKVAGGGLVRTHGDHRIAMSHLILGLGAEAAVAVDEPGMIATSFPGFVELMNGLGAGIEAA